MFTGGMIWTNDPWPFESSPFAFDHRSRYEGTPLFLFLSLFLGSREDSTIPGA